MEKEKSESRWMGGRNIASAFGPLFLPLLTLTLSRVRRVVVLLVESLAKLVAQRLTPAVFCQKGGYDPRSGSGPWLVVVAIKLVISHDLTI